MHTRNLFKDFIDLEVDYDIPAKVGMDENEIQTPCLILGLDALERNIIKMGRLVKEMRVRLRVHGKSSKISRHRPVTGEDWWFLRRLLPKGERG